MTGAAIDLNADMGESDDAAQVAVDEAILNVVTSANIACGGHAGDAASMDRTVRAARERGVAIGAHPSFVDRAHFGRSDQDLPAGEIERIVAEQIAALGEVAARAGVRLAHVKPHGALYHAAMTRMPVALAVARAARRVDPALMLVGLAGAPALAWWRGEGVPVAAEAFADRRYEPDGSLRARSKPDALITDAELVARQAVSIATGRGAACGERTIGLEADTLCLHSDTPGAAALAAAVRAALEQAQVKVERLSRSSRG